MLSYRNLAYSLAILLLAGCVYWKISTGNARAEGEEPKPAPKKEEGKPPAAEPPPKELEEIIAEIPRGPLEESVVLQAGDIKVTLATVEKVESAYVTSQKKTNPEFKLEPDFQSYMRRHFAFRFLANALVEKYVKDKKIEVPKDKFTEQFNKFKEAKMQQGASYEQWLLDNGLSDEEFQRVWGANWAIEQSAGATVKDEDVDKMYEQYKGQMEQMPLRRASHVLFMYKGSDRAPETVTRSKDEAKAAAAGIVKKLKEGAKFEELAKASSDCPSKEQGGDLNFFPRKGGMVEPFAEATYKLGKVGDTTDVVETPFGFHVIKLTELRDFKTDIRQHIVSEKFGKQMQQLLQEGVANAKFNEKLVAAAPPPKPKMPQMPGGGRQPSPQPQEVREE